VPADEARTAEDRDETAFFQTCVHGAPKISVPRVARAGESRREQ
jgi:hypothetical protein